MPVPRNHLTYALAASGIMALAITFAVGRSSPPPTVATDGDTPTATTTIDFDETWRSSSGPLALQKAVTEAKMVPLIKIVPDPPPPPPPKMPPLVPATEVAVAAAAEVTSKPRVRNLCERHGMRKVMTGRYGWRCRK